MQIFVTEPRVALALASTADWRPAVLEGYSHDASGCLVVGLDHVKGVMAKCDDRSCLDAYFGLFSGCWVDVLIKNTQAQVFLSNSNVADFFEHDRFLF